MWMIDKELHACTCDQLYWGASVTTLMQSMAVACVRRYYVHSCVCQGLTHFVIHMCAHAHEVVLTYNCLHVHTCCYTQRRRKVAGMCCQSRASWIQLQLLVEQSKGFGIYWTTNYPQSQWKALVGYELFLRSVYYFRKIHKMKVSAKIVPTKSLRQVCGCGFLLIYQKLIPQIAAISKFTKYTPLKNNPAIRYFAGVRPSQLARYDVCLCCRGIARTNFGGFTTLIGGSGGRLPQKNCDSIELDSGQFFG